MSISSKYHLLTMWFLGLFFLYHFGKHDMFRYMIFIPFCVPTVSFFHSEHSEHSPHVPQKQMYGLARPGLARVGHQAMKASMPGCLWTRSMSEVDASDAALPFWCAPVEARCLVPSEAEGLHLCLCIFANEYVQETSTSCGGGN
ncbi:unnamed protein product [Durusdinium trenchii]|uniref:Secreted protein n=1 Tax=Durusdinium trenchii TaxID=1381693 RepID=A0ABP0S677_9DINO